MTLAVILALALAALALAAGAEPLDDGAPPALAAEPSAPTASTRALVDLELQDADIHAALRFLAEAGDVNVVVDDRVQGTITVRLRQVTWEDAFAAVLASKGLVAVPVGSTTWRVGPGR